MRWNAILKAAEQLGISVSPNLTGQLGEYDTSPRPGYKVTLGLVKSRHPFTALFTFNDISAMGAIRALRESGLRVPEDVSVVGFDDIRSAAYQNPSLTTVRQPLRKMGTIAAETVLHRICGPSPNGRPGQGSRGAAGRSASSKSAPQQITVAPELMVRETTGPARALEPPLS